MSQPITLNIGGVKYSTSKPTLLKIDSIFKDLLENTVDNNEIFIDRDGDLFKYILNYFRNLDNIVLPYDIKECRELINESMYYCLPNLKKLIENHINILRDEGKIIDFDYSYLRVDIKNGHTEFVKECNDYIKDGWILHKNINSSRFNEHCYLIQTFVKRQNILGLNRE